MPLLVFNTLSLILGLILLMQSLREFGNQPLSYFTEEKKKSEAHHPLESHRAKGKSAAEGIECFHTPS